MSIAAAPLGRDSINAHSGFADLRVLVVHHWLYTHAGAERVLEHILQVLPHADVLAGIIAPHMQRPGGPFARARESWVGRIPGARRHHRWFLPAHALAFAAHDTREYDLVISISHAFEKAIRTRPGAVHVSYCLSPPRYLWDLSAEHADYGSIPQRLALSAARAPLRAMDRAFARGVHHFVSLSHVVAERVQRAYGRDSAVVYPPVSRKASSSTTRTGSEPFLLTLGRLVPYKRVDLAIRAAEELGIRLVVAGEGPERPRLERLGGRHTEFVGAVSESQAASLLSTCAAFVFCAEEDFGIAPLEANAHGAPVVAYRAGAALETMREGQSAVFFRDRTPAGVAEAIRSCLATSWNPQVLLANAERFSPEAFRSGMRDQLAFALDRYRR